MILKHSIFIYKIESSSGSTGANIYINFDIKMYVYVSSVPKVYIDRYFFLLQKNNSLLSLNLSNNALSEDSGLTLGAAFGNYNQSTDSTLRWKINYSNPKQLEIDYAVQTSETSQKELWRIDLTDIKTTAYYNYIYSSDCCAEKCWWFQKRLYNKCYKS